MQTVLAYNYPIKILAQIVDDYINQLGYDTEWRQVYSREITAFQGVNNPVKITFLNTDQKTANIANLTISVNLFTPETQYQWLSKTANVANASTGIAWVTFTSSDLQPLEYGMYEIGMTATDVNSGQVTPVYLNDNYQGRLTFNLLPGPVSTQTPPVGITFTDVPLSGVVSNYIDLTVRPQGDSTLTFFANLIVPYTGNIIAQGAMITNPVYPSDFANIVVENYSNFSGNTMLNVLGTYSTMVFLVDQLDPGGQWGNINANNYITSSMVRY